MTTVGSWWLRAPPRAGGLGTPPSSDVPRWGQSAPHQDKAFGDILGCPLHPPGAGTPPGVCDPFPKGPILAPKIRRWELGEAKSHIPKLFRCVTPPWVSRGHLPAPCPPHQPHFLPPNSLHPGLFMPKAKNHEPGTPGETVRVNLGTISPPQKHHGFLGCGEFFSPLKRPAGGFADPTTPGWKLG